MSLADFAGAAFEVAFASAGAALAVFTGAFETAGAGLGLAAFATAAAFLVAGALVPCLDSALEVEAFVPRPRAATAFFRADFLSTV